MKKKVIIILVSFISFVSFISLYLFCQGYKITFDSNIRSIINQNELVYQCVENNYNLLVYENNEEIYGVVYKQIGALIKVCRVYTFTQDNNKTINYFITRVDNNKYAYFGVIYNENVSRVSFLREKSIKLITLSKNKIFFGITSSYDDLENRYSIYDLNGNILDYK